jgi:ribosomal protein L29
MKKQDLKNWRGKEIAEIEGEIEKVSVKLTSAYLTKSAGKLQNTALIKNFRREIAQLKTVIKEKQGKK